MLRQIISLSFLSLLLSTNIMAAQNYEQVRTRLKEHVPNGVIDEITATPVNGLVEVRASGGVFYVTTDGNYVIAGDMIDLSKKQNNNLTENARKKIRLAGIKKLGDKNMLSFSPKNPKHTITIFTDVDCTYCRKLHGDVKKINDLGIAVRYVAFPRSGANSPGYSKMMKIWCAKDKQQTFNNAIHEKAITGSECSTNAVKEGFELGIMSGVTGTPSIVFEDGTLVPGYVPPEKISEIATQLAKSRN